MSDLSLAEYRALSEFHHQLARFLQRRRRVTFNQTWPCRDPARTLPSAFVPGPWTRCSDFARTVGAPIICLLSNTVTQ